ncbi:cysteine hydrolase family protein [Clostridium sp. 'White wine YQ']|uniref:cysteine hydrolase family protein n=1 Tax=Clostridium sp. 'White wine YQ' TaxID=3027474 RepID=UPI00236615F1|nr:cysteine hydrolase family protein [Clostridium sp. 'White wine YQ']MDD7793080.1 cysteine hydrolase family protein [Clostridium sp. 'White wine YQ']
MGKQALLVIDVQNAIVFDKPYDIEEVIGNIKKLIEASRENNVEVIYIQHTEEEGEFAANSDGWKIYSEVAPAIGEKVIRKNYNSAFRKTSLKEYLDSKEIEELIMVGLQTEYCFDTSVKVAFEFGYKLIIPEKTNSTFDNGNISAKDLYEYYNYRIFNNRFGTVEGVDRTLERIVR